MSNSIENSPVFQQMLQEYSGKSFDVRSLAARQYAELTGQRHDASESIMFARELEHIFAQSYDVLYPGLKCRQLLPVNREVPPGADTFTYSQYDRNGTAREVDDYELDFPTVEVSGAQLTNKVVSLGASYQYSIQDMRAAAMAKKPLDAMKANAARLAIEEKLETIAAAGSVRGITGLLNNTSVVETLASASFTGSYSFTGNWATAANTDSALNQIQIDVANMRNFIFTQSKGVHGNNLTLLVTSDIYSNLKSRVQSPTFKDATIADFLLRTVDGLVAIDYWLELGKSGVPRAMLYEKSPDVARLIIPQEFEQFPPQLKGMSQKIYCHMRTGGVQIIRPAACMYSNNA